MDHIILEGFIGSGKATVGKKIAKDMALKLYEVEKMVSEKMKLSTAGYFETIHVISFFYTQADIGIQFPKKTVTQVTGGNIFSFLSC